MEQTRLSIASAAWAAALLRAALASPIQANAHACIHPTLSTLQTGDAEKQQLDELKQLRELAFVITDLEASTAVAAAAPRQYDKVQEMHDSLMRELIGRHQG